MRGNNRLFPNTDCYIHRKEPDACKTPHPLDYRYASEFVEELNLKPVKGDEEAIMATLSLTRVLREHYRELFNTCIIRPERSPAVESIVDHLQAGRSRYQQVADDSGIPWFFIAVIHNMESGLDFDRHLHNGDPLTARTVHVPGGRPRSGEPPFSWEQSAADALSLRNLGRQTDWRLTSVLYRLEAYNGWGYRLHHPEVPSPYLWSFSNHYKSGKYVADGRWSDTAVSRQCGAAVLLRRMAESGRIDFPDPPLPAEEEFLISRYTTTRPTDPSLLARTEDLQRWLNTFPGIFVKVDGFPGEQTSNAFKKVAGIFLPGDPRG
jgi:lysozyme family protein